jgi:hypothetical protein
MCIPMLCEGREVERRCNIDYSEEIRRRPNAVSETNLENVHLFGDKYCNDPLQRSMANRKQIMR